MTPDVVVDIGNSRMKWGRCSPTVEAGGWVSLPLYDRNDWDKQLERWQIKPKSLWIITGVNPPQRVVMRQWVNAHEGTAVVFNHSSQLPMKFNVDDPDKVGIDRVFGAIAAKSMAPAGTPVITVDVGTAVTVNLIDAEGVFQGGAILPGPRLMAQALHDHTEKLPLVAIDLVDDLRPAKSTIPAICLGIDAALNGGVMALLSLFADESPIPPWLFITGGGEHLLTARMPSITECRIVPELNLEGIRIAAERCHE